MPANPFSIGRLFGLGLILAIILIPAIFMIQYAFQPAGTTVASNVICTEPYNSISMPNVSFQYYQAACLLPALYGLNLSGTSNSPYGSIFNLTQATAFPKNSTNSTVGLNAGAKLLQFTGLSFVFQGIGTIIQTMEQLGGIFSLIFGTLLSWLPNYLYISVNVILKLIVMYIYVRLILIGISAWSKYDLWSS